MTQTPHRRLLLASASPARAATLRAAGIDPLLQTSHVDEDAVLADARGEASTVANSVLLLARAKAEAVAAAPQHEADVVLGCDSLLELKSDPGTGMGKPISATAATRRWHLMRGRTGTLHTGHWLITRDAALGRTSSTVVRFADVSDEEVAAYVGTGEPLQVAGAFTIDGLGGAFVTAVEGDPHGVVGVSLPLLRVLLARLGLRWTDFWARTGSQP